MKPFLRIEVSDVFTQSYRGKKNCGRGRLTCFKVKVEGDKPRRLRQVAYSEEASRDLFALLTQALEFLAPELRRLP